MENLDVVALWRAPSAGCVEPAREVVEGFDTIRCPGNGVYFATYLPLALEFQRCYGNGLQEIKLNKELFKKLVDDGVMQPDYYYPEGQSWHVPSDRIPELNETIRGKPNGLYFMQ
jgi:hypothetical protein